MVTDQILAELGLRVVHHNEYHASIRGTGDKPWILDLWPSRGKWRFNPSRPHPKIKLPPFVLFDDALDIVVAHFQHENNGRSKPKPITRQDDRLHVVCREVLAELEREAHCDEDDIVFAFLAQKLRTALEDQ
jgi:hypothetical protein